MTDDKKNVIANFRIAYDDLIDFHTVAKMRGATASGLLHQHIRQLVREEKKNAPDEFNSTREQVLMKRLEDEARWSQRRSSHIRVAADRLPPEPTETNQSQLFSDGSPEHKRKGKRESRAVKKDIEDVKRDAAERTRKKKDQK
jgi:hypothetical protein